MSVTADVSNWFDQDHLSDVVIKSGEREFKCHKLILSTACEYFKAMFAPNSSFTESQEKVVELKEDTPTAVEAVIRYIYSFDYNAISSGREDADPMYHLEVYVAAQKYLIPKLQEKVLNSLALELDALDSTNEVPENTSKIFDIIKLLVDHKDHDLAFFTTKSEALVQQHLTALMKLKDFRAWLEEVGGPVMDILLTAVAKSSNPTTTFSVENTSTYRSATCAGYDRTLLVKVPFSMFGRPGRIPYRPCTDCGLRLTYSKC